MNETAEHTAAPGPEVPGGATGAALIESGTALFARHGYDGASVRAITRAAGANLGAVTYHFGSKRAFYAAVLESRMGPLYRHLRAAAEVEGPPLQRIENALRAFFEHLHEHPEIPRLMLQETASGRVPPPTAVEGIRRMLGLWRGLVEAGQRDGTIREGDPALMGISIVSQPIHLTLVRPLTGAVLALDQEDPAIRARLVEHAVRFVRAGLVAEEGP